MSGLDDPPRLFEANDAPAELRSLLEQAHADGMGSSAIGRITAGVEAQVLGPGAPPDPSAGGSGSGPAGGSCPSGSTEWVPSSAAGKAGVALVVAAVVAGSLWMASGVGTDDIDAAAPMMTAVENVAVSDQARAAEEPADDGLGSEAPVDGEEGAGREDGAPSPSRPLAGTDPLQRGFPSGSAGPQTDGSESPRANAKDVIEEHQLLRAARAALERDPRRALALTREHRRRFPSGMLAQEREVIAIEALSRLGRSDAARSRADRFGKDYPDSPHGDRVDDVASGPGGARP